MANRYTYSIVTINVCGITSDLKKNMLRNFICTQNYDIVLLQEVSFLKFDFISGYDAIVNVGQNLRGTAVLIRNHIKYSNAKLLESSRGVSLDVENFKIVNIYAPSGGQAYRERNDFFAHEFPLLLDNRVPNVLIGGDFNCITLASQSSNSSYSNKSHVLNEYINAARLKEVWPLKNSTPGYTYFQGVTGTRLDRFYISSEATDLVFSASLCVSAFTDHRALAITVHISDKFMHVKRNGYWKLNVSILQDTELNHIFQVNWSNWLKVRHRYNSRLLWWNDYVKPRIRSFLKWQSSVIWRRNNSKTEFYNSCLRQIMERPPSIENLIEIKKFRALVISSQRHILEGYKIRARDTKNLDTENGSLYHIMKESRASQKKHIKEILVDGRVCSDENIITNKVEEYFASLYSDPMQADINVSYDVNKISQQSNELLNQNITYEEVEQIVQHYVNFKSPGPDGLPSEFYKHFWHLIGEDLTEVMKELDQSVTIPESFKHGVIVLVPKVAKPISLSDYRPISLLNVDYKIYMKCIKNRLSQVMGEVIGEEQTCTSKNNNIISGLIRLREIVGCSSLDNDDSYLVSVDFDHAFDRIKHTYLWQILREYNFSDQFINKVKNIYTEAFSFVNVNCRTTTKIKLGRSVRQGCPLSMLLFVLAIQPLLNEFKKRNFWINAYADDITIVSDKNKLNIAKIILDDYATSTGSKLNPNKCDALYLGSSRNSHMLPASGWFNIKPEIKILGILFSTSLPEMVKSNWSTVTGNVQGLLASNKIRQLSLYQRGTFINTYALSRAWYVGQILPIPVLVSQRLKSLCGFFLWRTPLRVAWTKIILPRKHGGLGVIDPWMKANSLLIASTMRFASKFPQKIKHFKVSDLANPPFERAIPYKIPHVRRVIVETAYIRREIIEDMENITPRKVYADMLRSHELALKVTYDAKIFHNINNKILSHYQKSMMYMITKNIYPTQLSLSRINAVSSPICTNCKLYYDSFIHKIQCTTELKRAAEYITSVLNRAVRHEWEIDRYLMFNFNFNCKKNVFVMGILGFYLEFIIREKFNVLFGDFRLSIQSKRDFLKDIDERLYLTVEDLL